jgi:phospholipid/cholesterol/gamma-HCH transport system permease protein
MPAAVSSSARASLVTRPDGAVLVLAGDWQLGGEVAGAAQALAELDAVPAGAVVTLDAGAVGNWDSALIAYLMQVVDRAQGRGVKLDRRILPPGIGKLLDLALAVPEKRDARRADTMPPFMERVGQTAQQLSGEIGGLIGFLGEVTLALGRFVQGRARFRRSDLGVALEQVGIDALGVVAIINFLVGLILAFVGAAQLEQFGAAIFVANLVGIAMVRDMAAIMTGIVMAGRSGAAFAASLGTMQSNQEIDALRTTGISPIDYLVLPRIVALVLMMPLLTLFADAVGVIGGAFVATAMLDLSWTRYFQQTWEAVSLGDLLGGLFKGTVYGALIAIAGCWRGMLSGRTAAAVGLSTTSAVVTSILLIIGAAGLFAVVFYVLGL